VNAPHILIVDADILVRTPLAEYLRECGYLVIEAVDSVEAQALLTDKPSAVDIVLADVGGQDRSGFALAKWIRERFPDIRVILAGSIGGSVEKAVGLCEDGPALSKPYDHGVVLEQIQRLRAARKGGPRDGSSGSPGCSDAITGSAAPRRAFRPASSRRHRSADRPLPA